MSVADTTKVGKRARSPAKEPDAGLLSQLSDISKNTSSTLVIILAAVIYCYFAIALTEDSALLSNSAKISLPIVEETVPILWFYYVAPILLVVLFIYFRISMQYYWRCVSKLRGGGAGSAAMEEHMSPSAVSAIFLRPEPERRTRWLRLLTTLESWVIMNAALWFLPLVLLFFWGRYLVRHDWLGTGLHITLAVLASAIAMNLLGKARRGVSPHASANAPLLRQRLGTIAVPALLGVLLAYFSFGAIEGAPTEVCERDGNGRTSLNPPCGMLYSAMTVLEAVHYGPWANLKSEKISATPEGWVDKEDHVDAQLKIVRGAALAGQDLRHVLGRDAFLANAELEGADLSWARLEGVDLRSANLKSSKLLRASLTKGKLQWADLTDASLLSAELTSARLSGANILSADFSDAIMQQANLAGTNGGETIFESAVLQEAIFENCWLVKSNFNQAVLVRAKMAGGDFSGSSFIATKLNNANLADSVLNSAIFYPAPGSKGGYGDKVVLRESNLRGASLYNTRFSFADLHKADLSEAQGDDAVFIAADLSGAFLIDAKLRFGTFARAKLADADLTKAFLVEANFADAILTSAIFDEADLRSANFKGADLTGASLKGALLRDADFSEANLDGANLTDADLLNVRGLQQAQLDRACGLVKGLPDGLQSTPCGEAQPP